MDSDITVSFVVPSKNEAAIIADCLCALESLRADHDEIIVVDNLSTDATPQIAESFPHATVVVSRSTTVAGVRNDGARLARGSVLAFVDADCVLDTSWREHLVGVLSEKTVVATGGGLAVSRNATWVEKAWMCGWEAPSGPVAYISTANLAVRRAAFVALGGFDESLETDEDTDFCRRVRSRYGDEALIADAGLTAIHLGSAKTVADHWHRQLWHSAGMLTSLRKHGPDRAFYMTVGFAVLHALGLLSLTYLSPVLASLCLVAGALSVPTVTALYRLRIAKCIRWFPHLIVLYALFYYARCYRMLRYLSQERLSSERSHRSG